jgi:iron complex transport system ATP-binding protein
MKPAVLVEHLEVAYGSRVVLRNLSFQAPAGAFFIIIGPNSSGKTTVVRTLAGRLRPRAGTVEILGRPLAAYTPKTLARVVAVVPQNFSPEAPFTVREMVLMGRSPHLGLAALEKRQDLELADNAMAAAQVEHLASRPLGHLSGGELQRVLIARALCQQPQVLILDEPTAALDLAHQVRIMDMIQWLQKDLGLTIIMISHDLNLAAMYGDQLLLMKEGESIQSGRPVDVLTYGQLEQAYGCTLLVDTNPLGKVPRVTLVPQRFLKQIP